MLKKGFIRGAALLSFSALLSRLLGLYRDHLLAGTFGATAGAGIFNLDTYYAAFRLPDLLYNLLIYGAISAGFVPLFTEYIQKKNTREAFRFTSTVMNLSVAGIFGISLITFFAAPLIIPLLTPGFSAELQAQTVTLTRIMLLSPIFFTGSSVLQGLQISYERFLGYSLAPLIYNLSIIVGIVFFAERFGVFGVAASVSAGALLHMLIQTPILARIRFRYSALFSARRPDIIKLIRLTVPRIIGIAASQFMMVIEIVIASTLATGSIAIFNYAQNLQHLPIGLVGIPAAIAGFGNMARLAASGKKDELRAAVRDKISAIYALIFPAAAGMLLLRFPIVHLVLRGGRFTEHDLVLTANTLGVLALGLFGYSIVFLLVRAFYAMQDTKTPLYAALGTMALHLAAALVLTRAVEPGIYGLAIANALAATTNMLWLTRKLRQPLGAVFDARLIGKLFFAAAFMGAALYGVMRWGRLAYDPALPLTRVAAIVVALTFFGAALYFAALKALRVEWRKLL